MLLFTPNVPLIEPPEADCVIGTPRNLGKLSRRELWEVTHVINSAINAISTPGETNQISEELLCKLEAKVDYLMEKQKRPLSPRRATVNSVSNLIPTPFSESPSRENVKTFQNFTPPYSSPQSLSPEFEARMREYMVTHFCAACCIRGSCL